MSTTIHESPELIVTSYCGPALTSERSRMRLQIGPPGTSRGDATIGYAEAVELMHELAAWVGTVNEGLGLSRAKVARSIARRVLTDAEVDDLGGCPLCCS